MRFRIAPAHYDGSNEAREREWELALADLNADCDGGLPTLTFERRRDGGADIVVAGPAGAAPARVSFPYARLRSQLREYRDVIGKMARADGGWAGSRDFDALDYAKKLVHDEAGDIIKAKLDDHVVVEHPLARRMFTVIFLLSNNLPRHLVNRHRRHGSAG